jgi:hypothetical protein
MSYAQLGRQTDEEAAKAELLRRYPEFSMERFLGDFGEIPDQPTQGLYLDGVRKARLNECATQAELQKYPKMTHLALCDARRATNQGRGSKHHKIGAVIACDGINRRVIAVAPARLADMGNGVITEADSSVGRPQCVYRTALAQLEIRVHLPARIRDRLGVARRPDVVDQLLQYPAAPFDAGRTHT